MSGPESCSSGETTCEQSSSWSTKGSHLPPKKRKVYIRFDAMKDLVKCSTTVASDPKLFCDTTVRIVNLSESQLLLASTKKTKKRPGRKKKLQISQKSVPECNITKKKRKIVKQSFNDVFYDCVSQQHQKIMNALKIDHMYHEVFGQKPQKKPDGRFSVMKEYERNKKGRYRVSYKPDSEHAQIMEFSLKHFSLAILKSKVQTLRRQIRETPLNKRRMSFRSIYEDNTKIAMYTGLPQCSMFSTLLSLFGRNKKDDFYVKFLDEMSAEDQLLLTLMKLRMNLSDADLALRFKINIMMVYEIVTMWIIELHNVLVLELMKKVPNRLKEVELKPCAGDASLTFIDFVVVSVSGKIKKGVTEHFVSCIGVFSNYISYCSPLFPVSMGSADVAASCEDLKEIPPPVVILSEKTGEVIQNVLPQDMSAIPSNTTLLDAKNHIQQLLTRLLDNFPAAKKIPYPFSHIPSKVWQQVPDKICTYTGCSVSWSSEQGFGVFAYDHETLTQDRPSQYAPCDAKVHHVRADSILFDPIARKLVSESSGYFLFAQRLAEKNSSPDFQLEILKLSRQYRSVLRACLEGFQTEVATAPDSKKQFYLQNVPTFYNMELIWHLCEILFIDVMPGDLVLSQLVTWIRFHVPQVEKEANKLLADEPADVDSVPNYWLVVIDCLLQRRIDTARALLKLHGQFETEPFQLAHRILRTMPVFELYGGLTAAEFLVRHGSWRTEAERLLVDGHFASHKYLSVIVKIVTGDDSVHEIIRRHCETWYQHMVACLLYTEPTVKVFDLSYHANQSIARYGGPDNMKQLDFILAAIMEIDVFKMVDRIQEWAEKDWLLTHLTNLLFLCGRLNVPGAQANNIGSKLHESLLVDYGSLMMSHRALWQVGVDYLDFCPTEGRAKLEALLSRVPFTTDPKALKIIQIAKERDMGEVVYTVSKVQGMRCLARGHLGAALTWAMRCLDPVFCSQLADIFLRKYIEEETFASTDLLQNLGSGMMLSDRLAFLGKYCEFCQMRRSGEQKEAGSLLVHMLVNKVPPKYFWLTMLQDAVPLLEAKVFSSQDVYDLMSCLQELVDDARASALALPQDQILKVRGALAQALADVFILEGSRGTNSG